MGTSQLPPKLTTVADSNQIISYITDRYIASNAETNINLKSFIPEDTEYWNEWSEKKLAVLLYPNITRSFKESWECFEYTSKIEEWNVLERKVVHAVGAIAMLFANGKIKKKYNIQNEREELYLILEYWTDAIGDKAFLHGTEITLPDLLVYGVLRSIEGVQTFKDVMEKNSSLAQWYQRVAKIVVSQDLKKR